MTYILEKRWEQLIEGVWVKTKAEIAELKAIFNSVFPRQLFEFLNDRDYIVIRQAKAPMAAACVKFSAECAIEAIAVLEEYRGQGIGDLCMKMILFKGVNMGAESFYLQTIPDMTGFFSRYGFKHIGVAEESVKMAVGAESCIFPMKCHTDSNLKA